MTSTSSLPRVDYADLIENGPIEWMEEIVRWGVCIVQNVPTEDGEVVRAASMIAPPMNTLYGVQFDVRVEQNPINIAYTTAALPLHMDLPCYESPPGLQFLHCLEFADSVQGGESTFMDTLALAGAFAGGEYPPSIPPPLPTSQHVTCHTKLPN